MLGLFPEIKFDDILLRSEKNCINGRQKFNSGIVRQSSQDKLSVLEFWEVVLDYVSNYNLKVRLP